MKTLRNDANDICAIISLQKGDIFFAKYIIPERVEHLITIKKTENGSTRISAQSDILIVVEGLHSTNKGCKHIRFIRSERKDARGLNWVEPKQWPRLRAALLHSNVETIHAPGGFNFFAISYNDEMAVPNFSMSGANGFIILRRDIEKYLNNLPKLVDSGESGYVWINFAGYRNTPDECALKISEYDPSSDTPPTYYNRGLGQDVTSNHHIFKIVYDLGSRLVKEICEPSTGHQLNEVPYRLHPEVRNIIVGRRLPAIT